MKRLIPFILCFLIIAGGIALWKYSGTDSAVNAQKEVVEQGYFYEGTTWMTPDAYNVLKESLALRDYSLQTSKDLVVLPEIRDGELRVRYHFFTVELYEELNKTKDFPSLYNLGFSMSTSVLPVLFIVGLIILAISVLPLGKDDLPSDKEVKK